MIRYEQYVLNGLGYHVDALDTIKIYSCVVDLLKIPADDVAWRAQALDILFDMHFSQWICLHTESVERVVTALFLSAYTLTSTWRSQSGHLSPDEISTLEKFNDTRNNILNTTLLHLTSVEGVKESRLQMIIKHFMKSQKIINGDKHIASTPAHTMYNANSNGHAPNGGKDQSKSNFGRVDTGQRAQPHRNNGNEYSKDGAAEANEASIASAHSDGWRGKHRYGQGSEWYGTKVSLASTRSDGPNRRQPKSHGWNDNARQANRRDSNNRSWDWDHGAPTKLTRAERPTIILIQIAKSEIHVLITEITASALEVTLVLTLTTVNVPMAKTREIRENMQNGMQEPMVGIVGKTMQASTQDVAMEETMIGCVLGEPIGARQGM